MAKLRPSLPVNRGSGRLSLKLCRDLENLNQKQRNWKSFSEDCCSFDHRKTLSHSAYSTPEWAMEWKCSLYKSEDHAPLREFRSQNCKAAWQKDQNRTKSMKKYGCFMGTFIFRSLKPFRMTRIRSQVVLLSDSGLTSKTESSAQDSNCSWFIKQTYF